MCGLAGFLDPQTRLDEESAGAILRTMGDSLHHRGPDDGGIWFDPAAGIGLAHRRLSILDLSAAGSQPMRSASGRFVIAYNGEVYNHLETRERLAAEGHAIAWVGHSDTETLLAAIEAWGLEAALARSVGMFAFALWDRRDRTLSLARDRIGEKPLYYGWQARGGNRVLLFGSELKALALHPAFEGSIDRKAVGLFAKYGYIPAPRSIYRGIGKVPPGCFVTLSADGGAERVQRYWSLPENRRRLEYSDDEAINALEQVLTTAVSRQMISDVPLGAFLSGGVDSSSIVALMQSQSSRPVKTFTIGFEEAGFDEAVHAKAVARHLGTDHTEMYVSPEDAMGVIPSLQSIYDEPFADSSQIPTYLVSRLAVSQVKVALSGDGGDELFAGYERYHLASRFWAKASSLPGPVRRAAASAIRGVPRPAWAALGRMSRSSFRNGRRTMGDMAHRIAELLPASSAVHVNDSLASRWSRHDNLVDLADYPANAEPRPVRDAEEQFRHMMEADMSGYLPDDIMVKVDRAAMAVSLETRAPFLDPDVIEQAWALPFRLKCASGQTKVALRRILYRHVPPVLIERPKAGFSVPVHLWLKGPLRDWAETLLDPGRMREQGFFNPQVVQRAWSEHLAGTANRQTQLWTILMFQSWFERTQRDPATVCS